VDEVATHTLALVLALWRRLPQYDAQLRAGRWGTDPETLPMRRLAGARACVLGMGRIGSEVAARLRAFGVEVGTEVDGADILSLHVPLTPQTRHLVDAALLDRLAPGAIVVNTGRGGLVDHDALVAALGSGQLAGAGLDVFEPEPLPADHPLRSRTDVLLTPHVAFYSEQALVELRRRAAQSVVDHFTG
jgi:D-3-phosphoglycerate dehydrogenase